MVCPVTYSDLSDTKNSTQFATSLGEPIFPIGIFSIKDSRCDSDKAAVIGVSIKPGAMQFTVMFLFANSSAIDYDMPSIPAFEAL